MDAAVALLCCGVAGTDAVPAGAAEQAAIARGAAIRDADVKPPRRSWYGNPMYRYFGDRQFS
jgi:hypothetical protein